MFFTIKWCKFLKAITLLKILDDICSTFNIPVMIIEIIVIFLSFESIAFLSNYRKIDINEK